ncbi:MAG: hypothetical protein RMY31_032485 [Dendronalium sp. ChiSLP03b]
MPQRGEPQRTLATLLLRKRECEREAWQSASKSRQSRRQSLSGNPSTALPPQRSVLRRQWLDLSKVVFERSETQHQLSIFPNPFYGSVYLES